jgi:hypothetical protein
VKTGVQGALLPRLTQRVKLKGVKVKYNNKNNKKKDGFQTINNYVKSLANKIPIWNLSF